MSEYRSIICQFCGEQDFDAWGLKLHLTRGWCDDFEMLVAPPLPDANEDKPLTEPSAVEPSETPRTDAMHRRQIHGEATELCRKLERELAVALAEKKALEERLVMHKDDLWPEIAKERKQLRDELAAARAEKLAVENLRYQDAWMQFTNSRPRRRR